MLKKISYLIISMAILVTGYFAVTRLNYMDRSLAIFSMGKPGQRLDGRPGAAFKGEASGRNFPDSQRQQFRRNEGERMERFRGDEGMRNGEGRGRGNYQGGNKINLRNAAWFTVVFALFTVIVIYIDKAYSLISKRYQKKADTGKY